MFVSQLLSLAVVLSIIASVSDNKVYFIITLCTVVAVRPILFGQLLIFAFADAAAVVVVVTTP